MKPTGGRDEDAPRRENAHDLRLFALLLDLIERHGRRRTVEIYHTVASAPASGRMMARVSDALAPKHCDNCQVVSRAEYEPAKRLSRPKEVVGSGLTSKQSTTCRRCATFSAEPALEFRMLRLQLRRRCQRDRRRRQQLARNRVAAQARERRSAVACRSRRVQ